MLYSDFGENDITDEYKLSFAEKFFKPVSMSVNSSIPGFGTAGIALKYDSTRIEKKILDNSNNYRLIFLIQHWEWLGKELKLFFIRLINNISYYEKIRKSKHISQEEVCAVVLLNLYDYRLKMYTLLYK